MHWYMIDTEHYLRDHEIMYVLHEHPVLFTIADNEKYNLELPGTTCKNLSSKPQHRERGTHAGNVA